MESPLAPIFFSAVSMLLVAVVAAVLVRLERRQLRKSFGLPTADRLARHFRRASQGFEQTQM